MSQQGYIKLFRDIQKHWLYEEKRKFSRYEAWLDLLMMVNHSDAKIFQDGSLVEVKRGERITSIRQLMDRWSWSNTKVTKFLDLLFQDEMISFEITPQKKTLIKIKNYEKWQGFDGSDQSEEKTQKRQQNDTEKTPSNINKNDKERDKNDKDKKPSCHKFETYDMENVKRLFYLMRLNNPHAKEPNFEKWANELRLMRERDGRTDEQIKYVIEWSQKDSFWKTNILSVDKLRKQYDQLVIKIKAEREKVKIGTHQKKNEIDWDNL